VKTFESQGEQSPSSDKHEVDGGNRTLADEISTIKAMLTLVRSGIDEIRSTLSDRASKKEWYSPAEVADLLKRRPFTVREWCRLQRIHARKRSTGRGDADEWEISQEELERIKNHGLLPRPTKYEFNR
jgi:hypothetical protein